MTGPVQTTAISATLIAAPWWVEWLGTVNLIFGTVAAIMGAIVGIHAVWRIYKRSR